MKRILVIDDSRALRTLFREIIKDFDSSIIVYELQDGCTAEDVIEHKHIDLVLLDIIMDGREGIETLTILKEHFPELPIIMISGDPFYLDITGELKADETLLKPISPDVLKNILAKYKALYEQERSY